MGKHFPWSGTAHPTSARYLLPSQTSHTKQPCSLPTPMLLNFSFESLSQTQSIYGQPQVTMVECPRDCGAWRHIWGYGVPLPPYSNRKTRSFFLRVVPVKSTWCFNIPAKLHDKASKHLVSAVGLVACSKLDKFPEATRLRLFTYSVLAHRHKF